MIEMGVCYMVLADKTYPKRLAFAYLAELQKEFQEKHGAEVPTALRPYSFARFGILLFWASSGGIDVLDNFIQKAKRQYKDSRAQWNLDKLNNDLEDVHRIMTRNIQDVLGRGEALSRTTLHQHTLSTDGFICVEMSSFSEKLVNESRKFHKDTKNLNWAALYQKYGPPGIVLLVVFLVFYVRYYWF